MANRLVETVIGNGTNRSAKVYYASMYREYVVVFVKGGVKQVNANYYTTDKQDAIDTANTWCNENSFSIG